MTHVIKMTDVCKSYNRMILNHITLEVEKGDYISITGESGCGKSTLMNIIGLIESYDEGEYFFMGQDIKGVKDISFLRHEEIGYIFQNYNLIEPLTTYENIEMPLLFSTRNDYDAYLKTIIDRLNISHLLDIKCAYLSGGEKQRIAIARALAMQPALIIADEPTGNLDEKNADIVFDLFDKLQKEEKTIIVITHDVMHARRAKRKFRLSGGKLIEYH